MGYLVQKLNEGLVLIKVKVKINWTHWDGWPLSSHQS